MTIPFPSREFDDAVAALCHGVATEEQADALAELLHGDPAARDEYLRRVALHAYLASEPGLFAGADVADDGEKTFPEAFGDCPIPGRAPVPATAWIRPWALAAGIAVVLGAVAWFGFGGGNPRRGETTRAVAMLNRVVNARWGGPSPYPRLGEPLEPGVLRLESGLAQVVFYNGARVVLKGPSELRLVSSTEAVCLRGTLTAEVPPPARGFRIVAPRLDVTDLGTSFGVKTAGDRSEVHVFEGMVEVRSGATGAGQGIRQGQGARVEGVGVPTAIAAEPGGFSELFELQAKSVADEARRYDRWRESVRKLRRDPSLWVHFDFEHGGAPDWRLPNAGSRTDAVPEGVVVGCEWREGRWATKPALEFGGVSDRVRLAVPGELESMTLAAWVRVQGLDRQINSLFMSDGFLPGTLHWLIRNDGVLGLTVIGERGHHQIVASPPVLPLDQFGIWTHLAVVLDGRAREVVHYLNGLPVGRQALRIPPPFRFGAAELGNWNARGFPGNDPFLVRNFSGAMDEFCLFARALSAAEVGSLHAEGRPQSDSLAAFDLEFRMTDQRPLITSVPIHP